MTPDSSANGLAQRSHLLLMMIFGTVGGLIGIYVSPPTYEIFFGVIGALAWAVIGPSMTLYMVGVDQ